MLKEGMILKPNINNMEFCFGSKDERLRIDQVGMGRIFCTDLNTGEYLGDIGNPKEVEFYYDVVSVTKTIKLGKNIGVAEQVQGKTVNVIPHPRFTGLWQFEINGEIWVASDYAFAPESEA